MADDGCDCDCGDCDCGDCDCGDCLCWNLDCRGLNFTDDCDCDCGDCDYCTKCINNLCVCCGGNYDNASFLEACGYGCGRALVWFKDLLCCVCTEGCDPCLGCCCTNSEGDQVMTSEDICCCCCYSMCNDSAIMTATRQTPTGSHLDTHVHYSTSNSTSSSSMPAPTISFQSAAYTHKPGQEPSASFLAPNKKRKPQNRPINNENEIVKEHDLVEEQATDGLVLEHTTDSERDEFVDQSAPVLPPPAVSDICRGSNNQVITTQPTVTEISTDNAQET